MANKPEADADVARPVSAEEGAVALSGTAIYANRFYVHLVDIGTRVAFCEAGANGVIFRAAVLISRDDARALRGLLDQILNQPPAPAMTKQ